MYIYFYVLDFLRISSVYQHRIKHSKMSDTY